MMINEFFTLNSIGWGEAAIRICLAILFGFMIGFDRGSKNKPVDYRVYMIVASSTCLLAMMGVEMTNHSFATSENVELGLLRIVQGVLTGIGFLGAGAIIQPGDDTKVIGTATGASIWAAGSMGLMLGFGLYVLALMGFAVLLLILVLFGYLKKPIFDEND